MSFSDYDGSRLYLKKKCKTLQQAFFKVALQSFAIYYELCSCLKKFKASLLAY